MPMKKYLIAVVFVTCCFIYVDAQVIGKSFPKMEAENVENMVISIPEDSKGKYTLVGLAYSKKSEKDLDSWLIPVYNTFIRRPEKPGLFSSFAYDINVYIIPMFTGVNAAAQGTAKKKAAANVDPKLHPYLLFFKGKLKPYKESLGFEKRDVPYFFVLDEDGKIVYATSGTYSESKMDEIEDQIVD